jgi:hypothetical protein
MVNSSCKSRIVDGTRLTVEYAKQQGKPYLVLSLAEKASAIQTVRTWVLQNSIKVLNIGGPRESNWPGINAESTELFQRMFIIFKHAAPIEPVIKSTQEPSDSLSHSFLLDMLCKPMPKAILTAALIVAGLVCASAGGLALAVLLLHCRQQPVLHLLGLVLAFLLVVLGLDFLIPRLKHLMPLN